ncbi:glycosyltransferase family 2 protein [Akkermansia sp.]|uniref:glycosyltransferase family 2 protein n=1 Tax=Akkermansia sp. TaxID=1872421 RepID=UPI0025C5E3D2|nr:glycosyltransferase family 2 protein [Akkermansia sp.]MCC8147937.1 glycosyltransferase [Akkermansia sp.]
MNESPFLSIVIPVYNGEDRISRCLESIWSQGLEPGSYEIICVDDCSTDGTVALLEKLQREHGDLRVLKNAANLRAGGSRNHGVRKARGEYVLFIDADDYFHSGSLKKACSFLQKHQLDILMCDFARETEAHSSTQLIHHFKNREVLSGRMFLLKNSLPYSPWKYLFRKQLMVVREIFFEEKVCCEDVDWTHRMALAAETMQYVPILLVHNVLNDYSTTANEHRTLKSVSDKFFAGFRLLILAEQYQQYPEIASRLTEVATEYYRQGIRYMAAVYAPISQKQNVLCQYIPNNYTLIQKIKMTKKFSFLFALLSNLAAPFVQHLISFKRKYAGR